MKVAITTKEKSLNSDIDQRFGRAKYFVIVDTETNEVEYKDNEINMNAAQGAGIQTGQYLATLNVTAVITGHVGPNAFRTLSVAGIDIYTVTSGLASAALDELKQGKLKPVESSDVEGHW
jgi:predicted Fe-Mo cluster-binding NifX family protein